MDTNGNGQKEIRNKAISDLYAAITLKLEEYQKEDKDDAEKFAIVAHCMDIVEQEACKLWKA